MDGVCGFALNGFGIIGKARVIKSMSGPVRIAFGVVAGSRIGHYLLLVHGKHRHVMSTFNEQRFIKNGLVHKYQLMIIHKNRLT